MLRKRKKRKRNEKRRWRNKMAVLRNRDVVKMNASERKDKLKELRIELVKKSAPSQKGGKIKAKEIKKAIARILTQDYKEQLAQNKGGKKA